MQFDIDPYLSPLILTACATCGLLRGLGIQLHRGTCNFTRMSWIWYTPLELLGSHIQPRSYRVYFWYAQHDLRYGQDTNYLFWNRGGACSRPSLSMVWSYFNIYQMQSTQWSTLIAFTSVKCDW